MNTVLNKADEATRDAGLCGAIMLYVHKLGYNGFNDEISIIKLIKKNNIDISQYELPYHAKNISEWEQQALKTKEIVKKIEEDYQKLVKEGKVMTLRRETM